MHFRVLLLCAVTAAAEAGYLAPAFRYGGPAPAIAYAAAPAVSYAAPAIARVEHLAPAVSSFHKSEVYSTPLIRTAHIASTLNSLAPAPLIAAPSIHSAPLLRSGYFGHGFNYGAAVPLSFAHYGALW
ncbi:hypothetical protein FQR65_LT00510 [Abscondita terminalis]|nr:hypothetical protein FQR65_LT00510 [Abscondita terminalis]